MATTLTTTLTEDVLNALRISSRAPHITNEADANIFACKKDLEKSGINSLDETDPLIKQAITIYCKAAYDYNGKGVQFADAYQSLKTSLALAEEYQTPPPLEDQKGAV